MYQKEFVNRNFNRSRPLPILDRLVTHYTKYFLINFPTYTTKINAQNVTISTDKHFGYI